MAFLGFIIVVVGLSQGNIGLVLIGLIFLVLD